MSIAPLTEGGSAAQHDHSSARIPGLAVAGLVIAGVAALVRLARAPERGIEEVPDTLRDDVGLPRRHHGGRGWWEWR